MFIFGGYVKGSKSNDLWKFDLNSMSWTCLGQGDKIETITSPNKPCQRIGSAMLCFNNAIYLFGGHDAFNEKLNDLWKFDLASNQWAKID